MEKVAKLKKFSSKLKSFVVGCHVMYSVSDFKFLPISCKGLQRLSSVPLPVMSLSLIMSYDLSNHSIKNITLQNTTQDFSEGRLDNRLLRVIAALGN